MSVASRFRCRCRYLLVPSLILIIRDNSLTTKTNLEIFRTSQLTMKKFKNKSNNRAENGYFCYALMIFDFAKITITSTTSITQDGQMTI